MIRAQISSNKCMPSIVLERKPQSTSTVDRIMNVNATSNRYFSFLEHELQVFHKSSHVTLFTTFLYFHKTRSSHSNHSKEYRTTHYKSLGRWNSSNLLSQMMQITRSIANETILDVCSFIGVMATNESKGLRTGKHIEALVRTTTVVGRAIDFGVGSSI